MRNRHRAFHKPLLCLCFALFTAGGQQTRADEPDVLIADFEGDDYGNWQTTGEAFGAGPARGTLPNQMKVDGFRGKGLVNSFRQGDGATGTLTSPPLTLKRKYIRFLIGGGGHEGQTCINLLVDGKIVRTATGPNLKPGGSERLEWQQWDVGEWGGKTAAIEIVDKATGSWGHVNIDHIVQTDRPMPVIRSDVSREFAATKRYLNLPVKNGAPRRVVEVLVEGRAVRRFDIELADAEPDWWAPLDLSPLAADRVTLRVDRLAEDSQALTLVEPSDTIEGAEQLYREKLRPQFHFSARRGWLNDPNGLAFYNGEYHLFFQHNPYGWSWGNMHWGHAVSRDLVHWQEQGDTLYPDDMGPMFSGSAVVDWKNTSGFGTADKPALVLLYTAAGNPAVQCVAYSTDGRAFTKYRGNPVVKQITGGNRDPKVIWHEPSQHWVMTLYVGMPGEKDAQGKATTKHTIHFLTSPNLKDWTVGSVVEGFYECPDLFDVPLDGDAAQVKWILTGASSEYMVGSFDGRVFTPETPKLAGHRGRGFYAAQTFSDIPARDGRRIQIGWLQAPSPGMPFNQAMSLPLELRLRTTGEGPRLTWTPAKELEALRTKSQRLTPFSLQPGAANPLAESGGELLELRAEFEPGEAEVRWMIRGTAIVYDAKRQELIVGQQRAPAPLQDGRQRLRVFVDRTTIEAFAADGLTYVPLPVVSAEDDRSVEVSVSGGPVRFDQLEVHQLRSAWADAP
jgi:sucrose-6-phosphate hydrolase SacC (GH32 family)